MLTAIHINTCEYATCSITPAAMLDSSKYGRGNCHGNSRQKGRRLVRDDLQRVSLTFGSNYCFSDSFKNVVLLTKTVSTPIFKAVDIIIRNTEMIKHKGSGFHCYIPHDGSQLQRSCIFSIDEEKTSD